MFCSSVTRPLPVHDQQRDERVVAKVHVGVAETLVVWLFAGVDEVVDACLLVVHADAQTVQCSTGRCTDVAWSVVAVLAEQQDSLLVEVVVD